jgi:hypothetical protein
LVETLDRIAVLAVRLWAVRLGVIVWAFFILLAIAFVVPDATFFLATILFVIAIILAAAAALLTIVICHQQSTAVAGVEAMIDVFAREDTATQKSDYSHC